MNQLTQVTESIKYITEVCNIYEDEILDLTKEIFQEIPYIGKSIKLIDKIKKTANLSKPTERMYLHLIQDIYKTCGETEMNDFSKIVYEELHDDLSCFSDKERTDFCLMVLRSLEQTDSEEKTKFLANLIVAYLKGEIDIPLFQTFLRTVNNCTLYELNIIRNAKRQSDETITVTPIAALPLINQGVLYPKSQTNDSFILSDYGQVFYKYALNYNVRNSNNNVCNLKLSNIEYIIDKSQNERNKELHDSMQNSMKVEINNAITSSTFDSLVFSRDNSSYTYSGSPSNSRTIQRKIVISHPDNKTIQIKPNFLISSVFFEYYYAFSRKYEYMINYENNDDEFICFHSFGASDIDKRLKINDIDYLMIGEVYSPKSTDPKYVAFYSSTSNKMNYNIINANDSQLLKKMINKILEYPNEQREKLLNTLYCNPIALLNQNRSNLIA